VWPLYPIDAAFSLFEHVLDLRMPQRRATRVGHEILLGDIGDVFAFRILGEEMVKRLIAARSYVLWNGLIPLFRIVKFRINVKNYTSKGKYPVANHLAYLEFCMSYLCHHCHSI
jgi:hypothetical protein